MPCPFPGMDPYLERREIWPDFHDSLITYLREVLQPQLRPKYAALTQDRLYVVEHQRPIRPDVGIIRTISEKPSGSAGAAVAVEPDNPLVVDLVREEVRQPVLHIVEPAAGNRIITAIEVLSPDNKASGDGRRSYMTKKEELLQSSANLVEIDLLSVGQRTFDLPPDVQQLPLWYYVVAVTRAEPTRYEFYTFGIRQRLPRARVPLAGGDTDVVLDLQAVFQRCWDAGPYPVLLNYHNAPPGDLNGNDAAWCKELLRHTRLV